MAQLRQTTVNIRVYGQGMAVTHSHGFLVDDFPTGLSTPIGTVIIEPRKTTFEQLRPSIQYNTTGHMTRRSLMFQEALFIMSRLPNLYDRQKSELTMWQFGFVKKGEDQVKLIHPDRENQQVASLIPELFNHDIVIVPLSQIPKEINPKEKNDTNNNTENNK
jgi:hypothetical protein